MIKCDIDRFDTSDYKKDNVYNIPQVNKKVIGLMKDENNGDIMTEFIGLRSKMYSYKVIKNSSEKISKKLKGINFGTLKTINFEDYYNCLFQNALLTRKQVKIVSKKHNVCTVRENKLALSPYDDKRIVNYLLPKTYPWGYNFNSN